MTATIHQFPRREEGDDPIERVIVAIDRMSPEDFKKFLEALKAPIPQDRKAGR